MLVYDDLHDIILTHATRSPPTTASLSFPSWTKIAFTSGIFISSASSLWFHALPSKLLKIKAEYFKVSWTESTNLLKLTTEIYWICFKLNQKFIFCSLSIIKTLIQILSRGIETNNVALYLINKRKNGRFK